jgi:allantoin racemase
MRIRTVTPIITESFGPLILEEFAGVARPDTEISNAFLESGPASIESYFDEAVAVPGIIARVRQAEREGVDAVIINCSLPPREGDCGIRSVVTALSLKGAYHDASIHI